MGKIRIEKLQEEVPIGSFNCGNNSIERMIEDSYFVTKIQHAYAFQIIDAESNQVLGYYMLTFRESSLEIYPEDIRDYYSENYFSNSSIKKIPVIYIRYIAIDEKFQKHKIGSKVLNYIINEAYKLARGHWPVRLITLAALKKYYDWYVKMGFTPVDKAAIDDQNETVDMYMDIIQDKGFMNEYEREE